MKLQANYGCGIIGTLFFIYNRRIECYNIYNAGRRTGEVMNWKKSILLKVAVLFVLLGSITAIFMGTVSYASAKHAITKNVYNTHKDVVWQISKSIDSEIQKNLAIIASLYYDENLKRLFEEKYTTEYDFIKKQASANEIVRQTKNTQPLNNCNIILFDADGNIYGTVADGLDISWLEEKPVSYTHLRSCAGRRKSWRS